MEKNRKGVNVKRLLIAGGVVFLVFAIFPVAAQAATLYVSPSSGSHSVGSTFSVQVYVSSSEEAMNAASGTLSFPQDKLELTSISKSGSIVSLWVQEPSFSNSAGTATFEGIVLNPGFTGSAGKLISATFRVKAAGTASVAFAAGSVLANDGLGTNILTGMNGAAFTLSGVAPAPAPTPGPTPTPTPTPQPSRVGVPSAPVMRSATHPDSEKWYSNNAPVFFWDLPNDITRVRLLVGESPSSVPTVVYFPPIASRDLSDVSLADGVWYFHVQLGNASGYGGTSHFRFQIDTAKPSSFSLQEQARADTTSPQVSFLVDAADETSGIDHYEFQIDDAEPAVWRNPGNHVYETPVVRPGEHRLIAKAVDKAGNELLESATFLVEPIATPTIIAHPTSLKTGESFTVTGTSLPGGTITLFAQQGNGDVVQYTATADEAGTFIVIVEQGLKDAGSWRLWAKVADQRGAESLTTPKVSLLVERSTLIAVGSWATNILAVIVPVVALFLVLAGLLWYGFQKFMLWKRRIRKEVREADRALHKAIDVLKEDLVEQVHMLEKAKTKRKLTKEEEKLINRLKKNLSSAERLVKKEIKDIKREVN